MTSLKAVREELAGALNTEARPAYAYVPEDRPTPGIVLQPAEDYVSSNEATFAGDVEVKLDVFLLVELEDNARAADELDEAVVHLLTHLPDGWGVDRITQPGPVHTNLWVAHSVTVTVSRFTTL